MSTFYGLRHQQVSGYRPQIHWADRWLWSGSNTVVKLQSSDQCHVQTEVAHRPLPCGYAIFSAPMVFNFHLITVFFFSYRVIGTWLALNSIALCRPWWETICSRATLLYCLLMYRQAGWKVRWGRLVKRRMTAWNVIFATPIPFSYNPRQNRYIWLTIVSYGSINTWRLVFNLAHSSMTEQKVIQVSSYMTFLCVWHVLFFTPGR